MPFIAETLSVSELVAQHSRNERQIGRELGWKEAAAFLRKRSGEIFAEGGEDAVASWFRTAAEVLTENVTNVRTEEAYQFGIADELGERLNRLEGEL